MFDNCSADGIVYVESNPAWVDSGLTRSELAPLIDPLLRFYVVDTPAPGLSSRSVPVAYYGWNAPWRKPQYLNKKIKNASSSASLYWSASTVGKMEQALKGAGLFNCRDIELNPLESAVFYDAKSNQTLSLFYHLRNGLAHGRFCAFIAKDEIWLAIEDVSNKRKKDPEGNVKRLTARILIKNETLHKWIKLIEKGPINC